MAGTLKNTKVKFDLLTDIDMLLMVTKCIRGGTYYAIYWYVKANNNYIKNYDKTTESSYLKYCDVSNLYRWQISQKLTLREVLNGLKKHLNLMNAS